MANLKLLAETVLEPLREAFGHPIIVNSGFRCAAVNKAVGGVRTSQHMLGQAADIRTLSNTPEDNKALFETAASLVRSGKINVGQLIDEYSYSWVHISTPGNTSIMSYTLSDTYEVISIDYIRCPCRHTAFARWVQG